MDDLSPDELKARMDALKSLGSDPQIQQYSSEDNKGYQQTPNQNGNVIDQNNKNIEKSPEQPIDNQQEPGIMDKAKQFSQNYENSPYFKGLFPNGAPIMDPSGGGGMVMGEVKAAVPAVKALGEGINLQRIKQLLASSAPEEESAVKAFGDNEKTAAARKVADQTRDMADLGITNADDVQRTTEQMNRQMDFQNRLAAQRSARGIKKP